MKEENKYMVWEHGCANCKSKTKAQTGNVYNPIHQTHITANWCAYHLPFPNTSKVCPVHQGLKGSGCCGSL